MGDHLFDSTINGVLDSWPTLSLDLILTELRKQKSSVPAMNGHTNSVVREQEPDSLGKDYHDQYNGMT